VDDSSRDRRVDETIKVTIVVPTYDEAGNVPELLARIMALGTPNLDVLFVDDASPDGTAEVAEGLASQYEGRVRVLRRPGKLGLGSAYVAGFTEALGSGADRIVEMDADLSHAPEYLPRMIKATESHDVVVGSRWISGGGADPDWGLARRLLSRGGSTYARALLGLKVRDTTTGFKCFRREALEGIDLRAIRSQGFAFQVEIAYACQKKGYRVAEVPIRFAERTEGKSKMSLPIILEALWRVAVIRVRGTG
jgi:dolichol-phosphate mannosyltransferase